MDPQLVALVKATTLYIQGVTCTGKNRVCSGRTAQNRFRLSVIEPVGAFSWPMALEPVLMVLRGLCLVTVTN